MLVGVVLVAALLFASILAYRGRSTPSTSSIPTSSLPSPTLASFPASTVLPAAVLTVDTPKPNQKVSGPLVIKGQASSSWFFEGVFPVKLLNEKGEIIASGQAKALSDFQTSDLVAFEATMNIPATAKGQGALVFEKDNPSGQNQLTETRIIAVSF